MTKPIVLCDMDGVLVDFDAWIYERQHIWPSLGRREDQAVYFLTDAVEKEHAQLMRQEVNNGRIFREAPAIEGAIGGLWALADEAEVWICTKPLEANINCRDDKAWWVRTHLGAEFEQRLIITPDKGLVFGHVLLDDHPKPAHISRGSWTPIVYEQPFTKSDPFYAQFPRYDWSQPVERLVDWAHANQAMSKV